MNKFLILAISLLAIGAQAKESIACYSINPKAGKYDLLAVTTGYHGLPTLNFQVFGEDKNEVSSLIFYSDIGWVTKDLKKVVWGPNGPSEEGPYFKLFEGVDKNSQSEKVEKILVDLEEQNLMIINRRLHQLKQIKIGNCEFNE